MLARVRVDACLVCFLALCCAAALPAQLHKDLKGDAKLPKEDAKWRIDPYTKAPKGKEDAKKAAMKKAGYVNYAPFHWAESHYTRDVDKLLPNAMFLWLETRHFKLASSLPEYKLPKKPKKRKKIRAELKELKKTLPKINARARKLDRWTRLHLFAMRLEKLYAEFQKVMGVTDADFPKSRKEAEKQQMQRLMRMQANQPTDDLPKYMGCGPHLGMGGKLHIMLCTKKSTLGHYSRFATGRTHDRNNAHQFLFTKERSLFFGTNLEIGRGSLVDDGYLHLQLVFTVTGMLIDGYKDNTYIIPPWLRQGLSNWFVKQIDPDEEFFTGIEEYHNTDRDKTETDWPKTMRKLCNFGAGYKPAKELMELRDPNKMTEEDHMSAWSRCDFLIKKHPKKFARFMDQMKDYLPHEPHKLPTDAVILANQRKALKEAFGFDYKGFDAAWRAFVLKTYPR